MEKYLLIFNWHCATVEFFRIHKFRILRVGFAIVRFIIFVETFTKFSDLEGLNPFSIKDEMPI